MWGFACTSSPEQCYKHIDENFLGNRKQETSVIIAVKTPYPQQHVMTRTTTQTKTKPLMTQQQPTSFSSFHLITRVLTAQPRCKQEPTWKTLKMLRKKLGTPYSSTTERTHLIISQTPRTTTHSTTTDHNYISDNRNNDFDTVNRNHTFDNNFDLDMHEPGD